MFKFKFVAILLASLATQLAYADNEALQDTQACLRNKSCDSMKTDAGKAAAQKVLQAVNGSSVQEQALYNISADIMPFLVRQTGGDPVKMQALMQQAETNPEAFLKSLPPELQAKIIEAAMMVEKTNPK